MAQLGRAKCNTHRTIDPDETRGALNYASDGECDNYAHDEFSNLIYCE